MSANILDLLQQFETLAKQGAEAQATRSARLGEVVQGACRRLLDDMTANASANAKLVSDLSRIRTPVDLADVQRQWMEATRDQMTRQFQTIVELSNQIAVEVTAVPPTARTAGRKAAKPATSSESGPATKAESVSESKSEPVAKPAPAPKVEAVSKPAPAAPVAPAPAPAAVPAPVASADTGAAQKKAQPGKPAAKKAAEPAAKAEVPAKAETPVKPASSAPQAAAQKPVAPVVAQGPAAVKTASRSRSATPRSTGPRRKPRA